MERPALLPLPAGRFPFFHEAQRTVHRDGHVEVAKAYYSVPPEYLGRQVWVRWDGRLVRIFNQRMEQIAVHAQHEPGRFSTQDRHIDSEKISAVERGTDLAAAAGQPDRPADRALGRRRCCRPGASQGVRVLVGLLSLADRHDSDRIEQACQIALTHGAFRLRTIRDLLKRDGGDQQEQFEFIQEHPIIRDLSDYGALVRAAFVRSPRAIEPLESERNPMNESLQTALRKLRLSGLAQTLDVRLQEAAGNRLNHAEFLELVLQDELAVRADRLVEPAGQGRGLPGAEDPGGLRLAVQPVDQEEADLRPGHLPVHPRGTGRAASWGRRARARATWPRPSATRRSRRASLVLYRSIFDVVRDFLHDEAFGGQDKILARYLKPDLLIIDDMGIKQLPKRSGRVPLRDHHAAVRDAFHDDDLATGRWRTGASCIGDVPSATAILDRFLHHAEIITITGRSYRLKDRAEKDRGEKDRNEKEATPKEKASNSRAEKEAVHKNQA